MKSLEQQSMSEDKKSYIDNEDRLAALKAKPVEDLSMEEFKALKEAKQANEGLEGKAQEEAGAEDAERANSKITENISKADIKEKAEKAMRSMVGNMGEWEHLPENAREVLAKLRELIIKPDAKLGKNDDWTENFKDSNEIDFTQVNEIVDGFNKEVAEAEENSKKFKIRKEAEEVLRSMTGLMGEWEHLPEGAREVRAKLVDLLMQEGTILDGEKKWTNNFKNLDEIDFEQVGAIVDSFKQEIADEKAAAELTERIKNGSIGVTSSSEYKAFESEKQAPEEIEAEKTKTRGVIDNLKSMIKSVEYGIADYAEQIKFLEAKISAMESPKNARIYKEMATSRIRDNEKSYNEFVQEKERLSARLGEAQNKRDYPEIERLMKERDKAEEIIKERKAALEYAKSEMERVIQGKTSKEDTAELRSKIENGTSNKKMYEEELRQHQEALTKYNTKLKELEALAPLTRKDEIK